LAGCIRFATVRLQTSSKKDFWLKHPNECHDKILGMTFGDGNPTGDQSISRSRSNVADLMYTSRILGFEMAIPIEAPSSTTVAASVKPGWQEAAGWPKPDWSEVKPRTYHDYVAQQLHIRYSELEGSMRTVIEPATEREQIIADQIYDYMKNARLLLEKKPSSLIEAAAYLNLADRYVVWLYPRDCLRAETEKVLARLEHFQPIGWKRFQAEIKSCRTANAQTVDKSDLDRPKAALDQAIAAVNDAIVEDQISTHLQIRCLGHLMYGGLALLVALCVSSPVALNTAVISTPLSGPSWTQYYRIDALVCAIAVALLGGLGGFLSALMDARSTKMTIDVYQERVRLLEIKPLVGALVALVLFFLLSWKVVPAISPQNFGSYLLVAFAAGFSEKYFLRLLPLYPNDSKAAKMPSRENGGTDASADGQGPQTDKDKH
jgi:hypothetical protein